jgi:hypothetical protein
MASLRLKHTALDAQVDPPLIAQGGTSYSTTCAVQLEQLGQLTPDRLTRESWLPEITLGRLGVRWLRTRFFGLAESSEIPPLDGNPLTATTKYWKGVTFVENISVVLPLTTTAAEGCSSCTLMQ